MQEVETKDVQIAKYKGHIETQNCLQNEFI